MSKKASRLMTAEMWDVYGRQPIPTYEATTPIRLQPATRRYELNPVRYRLVLRKVAHRVDGVDVCTMEKHTILQGLFTYRDSTGGCGQEWRDIPTEIEE